MISEKRIRLRRRFRPPRNSRSTIQTLPVSECYALAYYLYGVFIDYEDSDLPSDYIDTFFKLVKRANLLEHFESVMDKEIEEMKARGLLTPIEKPEDQEGRIEEDDGKIDMEERGAGDRGGSPLFRNSKIKYEYNEDSLVDDELFRDISSKKDYVLNFYRWLVLSEKPEGAFAEIISKTFLEGKSFENLPRKVKKILDNVSLVQFIIDAVGLSKNEAKVLTLLYRITTISEVKDIFNREIYDKGIDFCGKVLQIESQEVNTIFRTDQKLKSFGFIEDDCEITSETIDCIKSGKMDAFFAEILKEEKSDDAFPISSYAVPKNSIGITETLLKNSKKVNILLYGAPGSGKTEFARTLAKECGLNAYMFKNDAELNRRENVLCRLNCLLSINKEDGLIIIDEADSILQTQLNLFLSILGGSGTSSKKGTVNKLFETANNKVVWIVNHTEQLDESTKRRFNYSIRFSEMPEATLRSIADTRLKKLQRKLPKALHDEILDLCCKFHVTGSSVENIAKAIEVADDGRSEEEIIEDVKNVLDANSMLLYGKPKIRANVSAAYDETILNTNYPAEKIVKMLENAKRFSEKNKSAENGVRLLFYGLSGTGKTEFARYISQRIGKKILLKRVSDIFDPYVGRTEQKIKDAFEEAEQNDQILLFDEADSFFDDRSSATHSWERTRVNEFLTQMEEFSGLLICTTNLKNIMDPAMQRRFHICVEFKPLTKDGTRKLLKKYFSAHEFPDELVERLTDRNSVTPGDFGSLSGRIRFMDEEDVDAKFIIDELCRIQDEKKNGGGTAIGFR